MAYPDPHRGEVWIIDTGWQGKVRPCLVLSVGGADQDRDLVTYIPRTTSVRGSQFEVAIEADFFEQIGVLDVQGIGTIARPKLRRPIGELTPVQIAEVEASLCRWLGLRVPAINRCPECSKTWPLAEEAAARCEVYLHRERGSEKQISVYTCLSCRKVAAIVSDSAEGDEWIYPPESWNERE